VDPTDARATVPKASVLLPSRRGQVQQMVTREALIDLVAEFVWVDEIDTAAPLSELGLDSMAVGAFMNSIPGIEEMEAPATVSDVRELSIDQMVALASARAPVRRPGADLHQLPAGAPRNKAAVTLGRGADPTIALVHMIMGDCAALMGLVRKVLSRRGRNIVGLVHEPPTELDRVATFEELAEDHAASLMETGRTIFDLIGISNGTGLALALSSAVVRYGGVTQRLVLVDPGPPQLQKRISLNETAISVYYAHIEAASSKADADVILRLSSLPPDEIYAFLASELHDVLGVAAPSTTTVTRRVRSFQSLYAAECDFFHAMAWTRLSGVAGREPETLMVLSAQAMHGTAQERVDVKAQRAIFGALALELQLEGRHFDVALSCGSGSDEAFNSFLQSFLNL